MEINEEYLLNLIKKYEEEINAQKRTYESQINLLKAKFDFEKSSFNVDSENRINRLKESLKAEFDVKNTEDLNNQKQYFLSELNSQKLWYEAEIERRENEAYKRYEAVLYEKTEERLSEIKTGYEQILAEKDEVIKTLHEKIKKIEEIYKKREDDLCLHIAELNKHYEQELKPFEKLRKVRNAVKNIKSDAKKMITSEKNSSQKITEVKEASEPKVYNFDKPKVSVILPIYNVGKYLRQSLDSLINQTLTELEIICVNDGSTDDSYDILEEYRKKDSRIKVIHKENKGTGAARNDGLRIATGECIGFVDPDDWVKPNMFERLYGLIKEKNLDIAMCMPDGYDERNDKNAPFPYFVDDNWKIIPDDRIFNWRDLSPFQYPMCVWNKLYTKELFDKNHIDYAEGLDFEDHKVIFGTLLTAERIFFIREKLYVYRYNREGSVLSDNNRRLIDHMEIFNIVEKLMKDTGTFDVLRKDFLTYKIHNVLYYYSMIKDEFKAEYYDNMVKCIKNTNLTGEEYSMLCEKYPELASIDLSD